MKVAYLILAHKNPNQLEKLIASLEERDVCFFIHIDKKSHEDFRSIQSTVSSITFIDRINVTWGGWTQVSAIISLLSNAIESNADRYHLISGQDYPIKSREAIRKAFSNDLNYIEYFPLPHTPWKGLWRIERFHFIEAFSILQERTRERINRLLDLVSKLYKRKMPTGFIPYGGSTWWSITHDCARLILQTINDRPDIIQFFRYTKCPDEMFFQTIVMNSSARAKCVPNNMRYIKWISGSHPENLTLEHFSDIQDSNCVFARKFEHGTSDALIARLQEELIQ